MELEALWRCGKMKKSGKERGKGKQLASLVGVLVQLFTGGELAVASWLLGQLNAC